MVVDIRYQNKGPEQFQDVRLITVYPHDDGIAKPEVVLHTRDAINCCKSISLADIQTIAITND